MVVAFTPNIGLAKPDDAELALNWARSAQLSDDNNDLIAAAANIVLTPYTPTIIAPTTNPNVGAGFISGEYCKVEGMIWGAFSIRFTDPGVLPGTGSGSYAISLPELADVAFHTAAGALLDLPATASCIGEGYLTDTSSVPNSGTVSLELLHLGGIAYVRPMTEAYAGKAVRWFGPTFPFTIATTDAITGQFFYKAAS